MQEPAEPVDLPAGALPTPLPDVSELAPGAPLPPPPGALPADALPPLPATVPVEAVVPQPEAPAVVPEPEPEPEPAPVTPEPAPVLAPAENTAAVRPEEAAAAGLAFDDGSALVLDGRRVPLDRTSLLIGRASTCDVVLDDSGASRRHAEVRRRGVAVVLIDLESTNGTVVNGRRIREHPLAGGDRITIGTTTLVFERKGA